MKVIDARLEKVGLLYEPDALFEFEEIGIEAPEFEPMPFHEFAELVAQDEGCDLMQVLKNHYLDHDTTGEIFVRPEMWGLLDYICDPAESMYLCEFSHVNYDLLGALVDRGVLQSLDETCWEYMEKRSSVSSHAIFLVHELGENFEEIEVLEVCK